MSPKSLFFLLAVGLCATQMVSAHREARGIADLFETAKNKLSQLLPNAEDPIMTSVKTVKQYINNLENQLLESGTQALAKAGIQVNLNDLASLVKDNVKVCAQDENVKASAKEILDDMATCVVKDVSTLKDLVHDMEDLWETARAMPNAIKEVAASCTSNDAVADEPMQLNVRLTLKSDHELAEVSNELMETASKHVSKRAQMDMSRVTRCVKNIFDFAKSDLVVSIPSDVMSAAANAFQLVQSVQGGLPACVAKKATKNVGEIAKLSQQVGTCVASGVANGDISSSPSLKALKQLSGVADTINKISSSADLKAVSRLTQYLG